MHGPGARASGFAHYMVCLAHNGNATLEAYEREIRLARQYGIDGFALNCGSWTQEPYYVERSTLLYEAAQTCGSKIQAFLLNRHGLRSGSAIDRVGHDEAFL